MGPREVNMRGPCRRSPPMFHLVLVHPQIPPNTGNVIRLAANVGAALHLVEPLGFALDHARMRRAGLDYHEFVRVQVHATLEAFQSLVRPPRCFAFSTSGTQRFDQPRYVAGDALLFGSETTGLDRGLLGTLPPDQVLRLPMRPGNRSLNLSNAVAVAAFEVWRQLGFEGAG